jgi:Transglycosylase SLT domain
MWTEKMKGCIVLEYKWVLFLKAMMFTALLLAGFMFFSTVLKNKNENGYAKPIIIYKQNPVATDRMKPFILQWMKEKSTMPEKVLSRIYDEAVNKSHPEVILAISMVESNFNPIVRSNKGAIGLMGIMPAVWLRELKEQGIIRQKSDLYLISNNMDSGIYVLRKYMEQSNDMEEALMDYVGGDISYVGKVMKALGEIHIVKMLNSPAPSRDRHPSG